MRLARHLPRPAVADQAHARVDLRLVEQFPLVVDRSSDDQLNQPPVARRAADLLEPELERIPSDVVHVSRMSSSASVDLGELQVPVVQAPLAGGASTPQLAAAVAGAGGFGFLAAGYKSVDAVAADVAALRELSDAPFGVNLFAPPAPVESTDARALAAYAERLGAEATRYGVATGAARHDDDAFEAKLELLSSERPAVVSFTFGCPEPPWSTAFTRAARTSGSPSQAPTRLPRPPSRALTRSSSRASRQAVTAAASATPRAARSWA